MTDINRSDDGDSSPTFKVPYKLINDPHLTNSQIGFYCRAKAYDPSFAAHYVPEEDWLVKGSQNDLNKLIEYGYLDGKKKKGDSCEN